MKTIVVNVLVSCVGSFLALSVFIGIMYVIDKIQGDDEQETMQQSLEEKMIDYFESHDIPYEDVENGEYKFTYQDNVYFWQYDKEDEEFLHIISLYAFAMTLSMTVFTGKAAVYVHPAHMEYVYLMTVFLCCFLEGFYHPRRGAFGSGASV